MCWKYENFKREIRNLYCSLFGKYGITVLRYLDVNEVDYEFVG